MSRVEPIPGSGQTRTIQWKWDTAVYGNGRLHYKTTNDGYKETYTYNSDGKLTKAVTRITPIGSTGGTDYTTNYTYDNYGRPLTTTYPGGYAVTQEYNSHGYLYRLKNGSTVLQTRSATNAFGQVTQESYGNGVVTNRVYDPKTGRLTDINSSKGSTTIQNLDYAWRSNSTLESRIANPNSGVGTTRQESFSYDALNRLTQTQTLVNGGWSRNLDYQYNALGNILSKTSTKIGDADVINYGYGAGAAGPHAVTSATIDGVSHTLTYDANGAITKYDRVGSSDDRHLQYNAANQPTKIVIGNSLTTSTPKAVDELRYDVDGQRYARKTAWTEGNVTKAENVRYIGNVEYIYYTNHSGMTLAIKTRVSNNVIHIKTYSGSSSSSRLEYAHLDHLGSIESVTDGVGNRLYQLAFEPFGLRKDSDWAQNVDSTELSDLLDDSDRITQGFTGHEHLDRTGFIHMNGRVYDPVLGRFLSPDPIVQAPSNSQSWNRYSYVFNSPVNYTDPSGYASCTHRLIDSPLDEDGILGRGFSARERLGFRSGSSADEDEGSCYDDVDDSESILANGSPRASQAVFAPGLGVTPGVMGVWAEASLGRAQESIWPHAKPPSGGNYPLGGTVPAWPTDHGDVTRGYSNGMVHPIVGKIKPHTAVDLRAPHGSPIYSVLDGEVSTVGFHPNAGNFIKIKHANGLESSYSHTSTALKVGDTVTWGQKIGLSDSSGRITGPHLHFVLRNNGARVNPMTNFLDQATRP